MEKILRRLVIEEVPALENEIYPTNAPEGHLKPYLVYARISTKKIKTLEGFHNTEHVSYMFSIMSSRYSDMKAITERIEKLLTRLPFTKHDNFYIQDIDINNIHEVYEHELKVNRGIIDFTVYYEKEEQINV